MHRKLFGAVCLALFSLVLAACGPSTDTKNVNFLERGYGNQGQKSIPAEKQTELTNRVGEAISILRLIALTDDVTDLGMFRTELSSPSSSDVTAVQEINSKCERFSNTDGDFGQVGTNKTRVWFENADTSLCPVKISFEERSSRGPIHLPGSDGKTSGYSSEISREVSYDVERGTALFNVGSIRSIKLTHKSKSFEQSRPNKNAIGRSLFQRTTKGYIAASNGVITPFAIESRRDVSERAISDTAVALSGKQVVIISVGADSEIAVVDYEIEYNGKNSKPLSRTFVNGKLIY